MKKVLVTLLLLSMAAGALLLPGAAYVLAESRNASTPVVTAESLGKVQDAMSFDEVVALLGQPDKREVKHDEGGTDPGLFKATWKSANGPVTIDFNAFLVAGIERAGKDKF